MTAEYYSFLAIRGHQGEHDYYLTQCPLRLVPRLFLFDEPEVPSNLRKVHSLNSTRVKGLVDYLLTQPTSYVLAPLVAIVDCEIKFESIHDDLSEVGQLRIPLSARLIIQDGQHRRAAIAKALTQNPDLGEHSLPVMLIADPALDRSTQLYADLNQPGTKRTKSQNILSDQENPLAIFVRDLIESVPIFRGRIELEKTTISNRSTTLFTLSAVYQATQALLGVKKRDQITQSQAEFVNEFWQQLGEIIPEWRQVIKGEKNSADLRRRYVHAHGVTLLAIGCVGHELVTVYPDDWSKKITILGTIDWSRENTDLWEGRAMVRGRMSKARDSIKLTANVLKKTLGLSLTDKEQALENNREN